MIVKIQDLARGGAGVSRDGTGRVVFVPFTAPGDEVRIRIVEEKKNYAQGDLVEVLQPSSIRQTPPCPVFGHCGGCQWQHLPYELQWKTKFEGVLHALSRAGIERPSQVELLPAEQIWEYRNRIQLRGLGDQIGFYAAGSNQRIAVDRCAIARPEINAVWEDTREQGRRYSAPYKVEVEVLENGEIRRTWNSPHAAAGFRQVHDEQNQKLRAWVQGALTPGNAVLDLYGGAGNLSLGLGAIATEVRCVDMGAPQKERAAQLVPQWTGTPGSYHFERESVVRWLVRQAGSTPRARFSSALLDPPREGISADFVAISESLETLGVSELVAVGCDPDSWVRDLSRFLQRGWKLEKVAFLDLFPQTPHVESLAHLKRLS